MPDAVDENFAMRHLGDRRHCADLTVELAKDDPYRRVAAIDSDKVFGVVVHSLSLQCEGAAKTATMKTCCANRSIASYRRRRREYIDTSV